MKIIHVRRQFLRRQMPHKHTPAMIISDGLILLMALMGTMFSFVSSYDANVNQTALAGWCIIAALMALVIFCLPRRWIPLLVVNGVSALVILNMWDLVVAGVYYVRSSVLNTLARQSYLFEPYNPPVALIGPQETAATLWLALIALLLALLLGWSIVRAGSFWLVLALTLSMMMPALLFESFPDWLPFMAMVLSWAVMLLTSLCRKCDPVGGGRFALITLPAAALLLAALTAFAPAQKYVYPQWAATAKARLLDVADRFKPDNLDELFPEIPRSSSFSMSGSVETIDLSAAGPLHFTQQTVLRVKTDVTGPLYLRGHSEGVYTGTAWRPLPDSTYRQLPRGFQPLNLPALSSVDQTPHSVTITNVVAPSGCIYFPYQLVSEGNEITGGQFVNDAYLSRTLSVWEHTLSFLPEATPQQAQPLLEQSALWEQDYRAFVYRNYRNLPDNFEDTIRPWRDETSHLLIGDTPPGWQLPSGTSPHHQHALQAAARVAYLLDMTTNYDPNASLTPPGEDFVSYFLTESRRGYCMHYASAAALLLRAEGIPTRYVSGYLAQLSDTGEAEVPDSSAHAWVEIYLDGYGWYPVEVTPSYGEGGNSTPENIEGTSQGSVSSTPEDSMSSASSQVPNGAEHVSSQPPLPQTSSPSFTEDLPQEPANGAPMVGWILTIVLLAALAACLPLRRTLGRQRAQRHMAIENTNHCVIAVYGDLQRLKAWGGRTNEAVEVLARKARFSQHILTEAERECVCAFYREESARVDNSLSPFRRFVFRYLYGLY